VQFSRIAFYWAISTVALAILWSFTLNLLDLVGFWAGLTFIGPVVLGVVTSVSLYFARDHQILEYDDERFSIKKGRKTVETRLWSEFEQCSVVTGNVGRNNVRLYFEPDGPYRDIDSNDCGVDALKLRDFALSHIKPGSQAEHPLIEALERELQRGRAHWIADLNETLRDYSVSGAVFPLFARGVTRPRGFLLSKVMAHTVMPNYKVCMYVDLVDEGDRERILRAIRIIESQRCQNEIKWSWLLALGYRNPSETLVRLVEGFQNRSIGVGYIDVSTGKILTSKNQLGRSMANQMGLNHLVRDLRRRGYLNESGSSAK
jgi:hypothetical protein